MSSGVTPVTTRKPRKTPPIFDQLDRLLAFRGYEKSKAKGQSYWLWLLPKKLPLYCFDGKFNQNKIFIDAMRADLHKVLAHVEGIIPPPTGTTKNSKFVQFEFNRVHPLSGNIEYEGWKFQFLNESAATKFLDICEAYDQGGIAAAKNIALQFEQRTPKKTAVDTITVARLGQQHFKKRLLLYWKTCAVTGCALVSLLRASHIKPWSASDSDERLDPFNGLLLVPNLDALFDTGLLTFDDEGKGVISSSVIESDYLALGLLTPLRLRKLNTAHVGYLEFHRTNIFKP